MGNLTSETRELIAIDQIILICNGCKGERLFYPNPLLDDIEKIKEWLNKKPTRCICGTEKCDAKMRIKKI